MNNQLKKDIAQVIKTNGNQEITGALLQSTLIAIVNELGRFGRYAGVATPQTVPETENGVFYIANGAGAYTNFGVTVSDNILAFITNMSGTYTVTGINKNLLLSGAVRNLLPDDVASLNSSVVGGNLESPRNVANTQSPVAITNTTLNGKGISKMITAGLANSRVECYIYVRARDTSDTLINIFNANKGKYIKVRWYVYSRFNVPPTMGVAANRMGVSWQYTDNTYSNAGIQNQTLTQIAPGVWQFQQIFQYKATKNLNNITFANVWAEEQAGKMTNPVAGDNGFSGLSIWIADDPAMLSDDLIVEDWINGEYNPDKFITGGQADARYMTIEQANETFAQKSVVDTIVSKFKLNSSVVGGNLESPRNVANTQSPVAITNTTLNGKGISKMITAGLANSRVECYITVWARDTSDTLINIFNANKGKYIKVRWYVYSRFNVPPTMGVAANRMGVYWRYTDNTLSNAGIQNQTLTQIASGVWQFQQIFQYNATKNVNHISFANVWAEKQAGQMTNPVAGDNGISGLSIWIADDPAMLSDDLIVEDWMPSEDLLLTIEAGDERYMTIEQANETFAQKSVVEPIVSKFKLNSFITGGNFNPAQDLQSTVNRYMIKDNAFLVANQTPNIAYEVKGRNNNVEVYVSFNAAKIAEYFQNAGKYIKIKYWVYSKNGVMATATTQGRLGVIGIDDRVSYNAGNVTYKKVDDQIFEVTMQWQIHQATQPRTIWICTVWEAAIVPADFVNGDLGVTGFGVWYADTLAQLDDNIVQYDWMPSEDLLLTIEAGDKRYMKINDNPDLADYNNIPYNQTAIAEFLRKYTSKTVDANNQINIALAGDSIFGRVDKSRGFDPANPEVTLTPDVNNPSETQPGYVTGHFPPNMWEQIVAFKVLQLLQYPDADVKYFNHVASEITKSGTWVDRFPVGADCLRTATTTVQNSAMTLAFSGASFVKFVYSCYGYNSAGRKIQVQFSDDNGTTWKTPADLGLTEKLASSADGSGIYVLPTRVYKFGNNVWGGLDKTKSYQIRVTFIDTTGTLNVWGFETWSNPRVNVVVTAEGGNTAGNQKERWERFYSQMYDQDLTIYELPYLNDLGTGTINNFKGQVTPTSTPAANPAQYDFYYAKEAGTYTNFGGVVAYAGAYIEWSGTAWVLGSTKVAQTMATYQSDNMAVFERLRKIGVPVLTIVTHESTSFRTRPYTWGLGLFLLRLMVKQYGFGCIDLNRYQQQYDISGIWSDGTHLNDKGVQMYADLINEVMTSETEFVVWAFPQMNNIPLKGTSSANTVNFGIEFKKVPTVRLYNTTQVVASVTQSGFTTTGSGSYDWEAIIE